MKRTYEILIQLSLGAEIYFIFCVTEERILSSASCTVPGAATGNKFGAEHELLWNVRICKFLMLFF